MKIYYRLNENGTILDFCEFENDTHVPAFIKEQYIETDRKIVRVYNGALRFEDETVPSDFEPPAPTAEEIKQELINGIQAYMNTTAQTKGYDDIFTAISYENSEDEIFKAEGKACRVWRDKVWRACYNILDEVLAGKREIPTLEELIEELPTIDW